MSIQIIYFVHGTTYDNEMGTRMTGEKLILGNLVGSIL